MRAGSKGHGTTTFTLVDFFYVSFEGGVHFLEPLFCRELTASSKNLIAIRTAPGDGIPVNFLYNH